MNMSTTQNQRKQTSTVKAHPSLSKDEQQVIRQAPEGTAFETTVDTALWFTDVKSMTEFRRRASDLADMFNRWETYGVQATGWEDEHCQVFMTTSKDCALAEGFLPRGYRGVADEMDDD